jgi:hypothetical protein
MEKFILDSREADLVRPKHEAKASISEYGGLDIAVGVVDARPDNETGRTLIWVEAYKARADEFEIQRATTVAEALRARVIVVEEPGIGVSDEARTTRMQKLDLARGRFKDSAFATLGALNEAVKFAPGEEAELLLFSQGAAVGAAMLECLGNEAHGMKLKIPRVSIIEAVNDQPWNLVKLLKNIGEEDAHTDRYLSENDPYDWLVSPTDRTPEGKARVAKLDKAQNPSLLLGGAALRKPFAPVLLSAIDTDKSDHTTGISTARIEIFKFDGSSVSRLEKNQLTFNQLSAVMPLGCTALTEITGPDDLDDGHSHHYHPAVHSMPNMHVIASELLK